jgi:hypothetical protein
MGSVDDRRALKARLGAARLVLEQYPKGSPNHKALSKTQAAALREMLGTAVLTAMDRADLANVVVGINWCEPEDGTSVLAALAPVTSTLPPGKRRRTQQDFMAFCNFGTDEFWNQLLGEVPTSAKLNIILQWAIGLGLRCPSEHSMKWLCSVWLAVGQTEAELVAMDPAQKKHMFNHTKAVFDSMRKHAAEPPMWIDKLPHNPVEFLRDFSGIYHLHYGGSDAPVPVPAGLLKKLTALDMSYSCRHGRVMALQPAGSASSSSGQMQLAVSDSPMERVANLFMNRMESMAAAQQRMMELMMGGGAMDRRGAMQPRSLAALSNGGDFAARRPPSIVFEDADGSPPRQLALAYDNFNTPPRAGGVGSPPPMAEAANAEAEVDARATTWSGVTFQMC